MIRMTGDIHGDHERLLRFLPTSREDYVIVLGDFGVVWDGSAEEDAALDRLDASGLTILFLDGNHENFDLLAKYPVSEWHGGTVQRLREHVLHLMRGQIYEIEGRRFFVMGGAESHDADVVIEPDDPHAKQKMKNAERRYQSYRVRTVSWWAEELPDEEELAEGKRNLERVNNRVDVVLTHCAPASLQRELVPYGYSENRLTEYLEWVRQNVDYTFWFFGHYHDNRALDDKHILLYAGSVTLDDVPACEMRLRREKNAELYRLENWYLTRRQTSDGGTCLIAHGNVYGNPRFPDGLHIHTSKIFAYDWDRDTLTVTTQSGSLYELRLSRFNTSAALDVEAHLRLGMDERLLEKARALSRREAGRKQRGIEDVLGKNELYLEVAGSVSVEGAWFRDESGTLHRIEPWCHVGMFQDSWLICEDGVVDFRLFPGMTLWETYHVSDNIEKVLFRNLSGQDVGLCTRRNTVPLPAGEVTEVGKAILNDSAEELISPDCYNGKSWLFGGGDNEAQIANEGGAHEGETSD